MDPPRFNFSRQFVEDMRALPMEHVRGVALYALKQYELKVQPPALRFIMPLNPDFMISHLRCGQPKTEEEQWDDELRHQLATVTSGPVMDLFKRRVRMAESVDEVHRLMNRVTGGADWKEMWADDEAATRIQKRVRAALADPETELCRRRLRREYEQMQAM